MRVTYVHRRSVSGHFSIEAYFEQVRANLPPVIEPTVFTCRFLSRGVFRRLYNMVETRFNQGCPD